MIGTKLNFRPYGTKVRLPILGRAKVQLQAQAGATTTTYVYMNDDDKDSSLLGEKDALRLGIIKINLAGASEEVVQGNDEEELQRQGCARPVFAC